MQYLLSSHINRRKDALGAVGVFDLFSEKKTDLCTAGHLEHLSCWVCWTGRPRPCFVRETSSDKACASAPGCRPLRRHDAWSRPLSSRQGSNNVWNPQFGPPNSGSMSGNGSSKSNMPNRLSSQSRCMVTALRKTFRALSSLGICTPGHVSKMDDASLERGRHAKISDAKLSGSNSLESQCVRSSAPDGSCQCHEACPV